MNYIYINSVVTAIGTMLIKTIKLVAGAQNENAKHRVLKFATNINFRQRMKESLRDYYYHPEFTMADKSFMMVPTPKDFGQYLQNKRNRRRKK